MTKNNVLIVGSVAFDNIKTHKTEVKNVTGGAASYSSIAASYFCTPKVVAVVGKDFTKKHMAPFIKHGVDLSLLEVKEGKTFAWGGVYDADFKNAVTSFTDLNVFETFNPVIPTEHQKTDALFLANIAPELQLSVLKQTKPSKFVTCDTMNYWINNNKPALLKLLKHIDILFVNEAESRQLTGIYNLIKAGRAILKAGPKVVVIKLGPNGALLVTKDALCQVPPYLVEDITDTTGAGDSFGGGFTGYLCSVKDWADIKNIKRAMAVGTVMASFAIESFSINKLASLTKKDIDERLKHYIASTKI